MTVPTNTLQTYQSSNNAEDVSDIIMNMSPVRHAAADDGEEGHRGGHLHRVADRVAVGRRHGQRQHRRRRRHDRRETTPTRVGNYTQLMDKTLSITTTQQAIKKYGVKDEWATRRSRRAAS
jgi:hypothetical protein